MSGLGVAVVGLGVGFQHALAYLGAGCRLRWLLDLDPGKATEAAARLGSGEICTELETILADPEVDLVSLASYDDDHGRQVIQTLEAGKHVFVEKPLCTNANELRRIAALLSAGPGRLGCNLVLRQAPLYRWLREKLDEGRFGELYSFDGEYLYGRLPKITEGWRGQRRDYSVTLGGGIHMIDLMLWLTGQRPVRVQATGNGLSSAGTAFRGLDFVTATLTFPSGLIGRITANFGCVHPHQHVIRLFGTQATLIHDDQGPRWGLHRDPGPGPARLELEALPSTKGVLIPEFVYSLLNGGPPALEHQIHLDGISVCLAIDEAAALGVPVDVEYS